MNNGEGVEDEGRRMRKAGFGVGVAGLDCGPQGGLAVCPVRAESWVGLGAS